MKKVYPVLFVLYLLVVLRLTVFRPTTLSDYAVNFVPFVALIKTYKTASLWQFLRLFLGNIGWFVPYGIFLPLIWKKEFWQTVLFGALFSFFIELSQFLFKKGVTELDDLILNTFGVLLGYLIFLLGKKIGERYAS